MAPSSNSNNNGITLRQLAGQKVQGKDSNPSQLGDPVSMKAEESNKVPTPTEADVSEQEQSSNTPSDTREPPSSSGSPYGDKLKGGRTLKGMMKDKIEQAEKGKGKNPTMLGDPTSLKAESTDSKEDPTDHDNGPSDGKGSVQRNSKL